MNILFIDDSPHDYLLAESALIDHMVAYASLADIATVKTAIHSFDLILLQANFSQGNAPSVLANIRSSNKNSKTPVILIAANDDPPEQAEILKQKGDDLISKPLDLRELLAKINVWNVKSNSAPNITGRPYESTVRVDIIEREIICFTDGKSISYKLTPTEFKLFYFLFQHSDELISRERIFAEVWRKQSESGLRIVDKHVTALRKKICPITFKFEAVHGRGYRMIVQGTRVEGFKPEAHL
jgi:DNA-binding response OmpR family regulator